VKCYSSVNQTTFDTSINILYITLVMWPATE